MKKLIFIIIALFVLVSVPVMAEDKEPVKFQVNFEIQYNAVTKDEAVEIYERVLRQHKNACKVKITTKKAEGTGEVFISNGDGTLYLGDDFVNSVITTENKNALAN